MRQMKEEMKEGIKDIRKEMKEFREREEGWKEEREEMKKQIKGLERRIEEMEGEGEKKKEGKKKKGKGEEEEMKLRLKKIEKKMERKEREERRKNLVIKGIEVKEGRRKEAVEGLIKDIGAEVKIEETWRIAEDRDKRREIVGIRIENEEKRREIWEKKKTLTGRKERIVEDWTWKERRMRWKLEKRAREEGRKGKNVWVEYGRIRIDGQWWKWDEEEEVLRDGKGVRNKDREFWEGLKNWDVTILVETWMDKKGWRMVKEKLPRGYEWGIQVAEKNNKKGRAMEGMIMGIKKEIMEKGKKIETEREGLIIRRIRKGKQKWRVVGVYVNQNMEEMLQSMEQWVGEKEMEVNTIIGGDFNARTGVEEGGIEIGEEGENGIGRGEGRKRKSKNGKINREGRVMMEFLEERGWGILNGCTEGEEEGEFTFTGGKGNTVIDYVIADEDTREKIKSLRIGNRIDSDHQPLEVWVKGERQGKKGRKSGSRGEGRIWRGVWNEERCKEFKQRMERIKLGKKEIGEEWEGMEREMKEAIREVERDLGKEEGKKGGWWDRDCEEKKKEVRRELRGWKSKGREGKKYKEKRKEYKKLCERKRKEENEKWGKKAREVKRESEVWEIINRERKRRVRINDGIEMEEWKEYFMRLLKGAERKVVKGNGRRKKEEGDEEEEISREEIKETIKRLRNGKAMGADGIPGEAWKYGGEEVEEWVWKWSERLRREVEKKEIVPENQTGFRKGMGTLDNIYIMNYLVNRQLEKKKGKMTALFIDLKAAFDSVDRGVLVGAMRERGVREGLVERVEEVLKETKSKVRVGGEVGENFWTARGVKQGCPLSPLLFNIMLADIEEEMGKVKRGGVKLRGNRIYSLAYADDMVLVAEEEEEVRGMMERLERYLERKKLELNTKKTKIMRFRKGGGRWKKRYGNGKGRNGGQEAQIRERAKKATAVMGTGMGDREKKIWEGLGEKNMDV
ncbi:golgin subfamily A member 6-like protein 22 [Linepithema humile]|uniref:golgin subfamily A member 6-like protein 22 n=1 Tax=Linepithema humile TaxID=83485 RepID=UPI00351F54E1